MCKCKNCYNGKEKSEDKYDKKNIIKLGTIVIIQVNIEVLHIHSICNLKYSVLKEIPIVCHNRSNCDYHFVIKGLLEKFEEQFTCFGENTE